MNMLRFSVPKCFLILLTLCCLTRSVLSDCRDANFIEGFDYFPDKVSFNNRELNVTYHNNYIIIENKKINEVYVLYCTAARPIASNINVKVSKYIQIPVTNVAVTDRSIIPFLEILGEEKTSLKFVSDKSQITSPCLQKHNDLYENINLANTAQVAGFDVIFTSTPSQVGGNYITITNDEETPPLRKAEWVKFVSLFYNKAVIANNAYDKIVSNYKCHVKNLQIPNETKKDIAWISLEEDGTFTVKSYSYYPSITMDAGAFILLPQITSDLTGSELRQYIKDTYIVIDMSNLIAPNNTLNAWKHYFGYDQVSDLPRFLKEKRLYRTHKSLNANGYDDWTERSTSRPDLVLQDLIAIQYPTYQQDYIVNWFDKFAETGDINVISADKCDESTFGSPKTDFGTCSTMTFIGDGKSNNGTQVIDVGQPNNGNKNNNNNDNDEKKSKVKPGVIIAVVLVVTSALLGLGAWLMVVARRRYRERFVKLRDEPVVQMDNVKELKEPEVAKLNK